MPQKKVVGLLLVAPPAEDPITPRTKRADAEPMASFSSICALRHYESRALSLSTAGHLFFSACATPPRVHGPYARIGQNTYMQAQPEMVLSFLSPFTPGRNGSHAEAAL